MSDEVGRESKDGAGGRGRSPCENLVLVGFMGCGKSTIGRHLAQSLGYPHVDMDRMIEEESGCSISEIFESVGEQGFRQKETEILRRLHATPPHQHIISTGGGVVTVEENRILLPQLGYVIWLMARPEIILERTARSDHRPLLQTPNAAETIQQMLKVRGPLYEQVAHLKVETEDLNFSEATAGIIESARYFFAQKSNQKNQ